ncbi:MAG: glycoside hydrolase family 2 TIM barrel-domain containing protein [bacterium]
MKKYLQLITCIFFFVNLSFGQTPSILNVLNRASQSLNGPWHYIVDPYENGYYNYRYEPFDQQKNTSKAAYFMNAKPENKSELLEYDFDKSDVLEVPGDWNTQDEKLFFYEGTVWYKRSFDFDPKVRDGRVFLYFGAVNYHADIYLNGKKLGTHTGGFTPFNFEITDIVKSQDNFLVVKVDNKREKEGVPTLNTDWWNYGGITRDVLLVETPATFISDYMVQYDPEKKNVLSGYVQLEGDNKTNAGIKINMPELDLSGSITANRDGLAKMDFKVKDFIPWSPGQPKLYDVILIAGQDTLKDRIGFRSIDTDGSKILLNGNPIFLKGICIHEERPGGGRIRTKAEARELLQLAEELGCNYVRLAHYPHNEHMIRLADEMGIMVWAEIPVYWTIDWENPNTYQNAEGQLTAMIRRDKNRASVIIWSMANETPVSPARQSFLTRLAAKARQMDPTRLISAALEQSIDEGDPNTKTIDDPFAEVVDVISFNQYIGWYDGLPQKCRNIKWNITQDKPVVISEYGAGAKYGFHADSLTRWSEEYQAYLYQESLEMLDKIPQLSGMSPWILMDFRSPRRPLPGIQDYWNRKGLVSEKGQKKMAFYILQDYYQNH